MLFACNRSEMGEQGSSTTLIVGRASDAIALDPALVTDSESVEICSQIYESLLRFAPGTNNVEAGLAQSWEVSEDGRKWNFALRHGVRFHDGTPLNAAAVVFSFMRQLDEEHPYHVTDSSEAHFAWTSTYKNIVGVEALDEYTVQISIERAFAPFAANIAMFPVAIVSPAAVKKWGNAFYRHPVGTGPFQLEIWTEGRIVLNRNNSYWGRKPQLKRLVFKAIADARQRLIALESGAVHLAYSILPDEQQFVALHPKLRLHRAAPNNVVYLAINMLRPPFDDLRMRKALNYAINKEPIIKLAYQGMAVSAQGALPPEQWGYTPDSFDYPHNSEMARRLIDEVVAEGDFSLDTPIQLFVPTTPRPYLSDPAMVTQIVKANLEAVGLRVQLVEQEFSAHLKSVRNGAHDLGLMGWVGDNGDPDNFLFELFDLENTTVGTARNLSFLRDQRVHSYLLEARKVSDREARCAIYKDAQKRIGSLAPWVPLAHSQIAVVVNERVENVVISPSGHVVFAMVHLR